MLFRSLAAVPSTVAMTADSSATSMDTHSACRMDELWMLMVILENQDYNHLVRGVHQVDPTAFMIAYDISEAHGGTFI